MSIIAEFCIESPSLVLYEARRAVPEVRLDVKQEIGVDPQRPLLFFWAEHADGNAFFANADADAGDQGSTPDALMEFEDALSADPTVTDEVVLNRFPDRHLYRLQFSDELETVIYPKYVELGIELLDLVGDENGWHSRMRFPDRESLAALRQFCLGEGVTFDLQRVYDVSDETDNHVGAGLTESQREAVEAALRAGYFDVPRGSTLADVADELGVSSQSASERLRRGVRTLARNAFGDESQSQSQN